MTRSRKIPPERVRPEVAVSPENVRKYVRLLRTQAMRLARAERTGIDDADQEIALLVMEALPKYDPHRATVRQWVRLYVTGRVRDRVASASAVKNRPTVWTYDQVWGWYRQPAQATPGIEEDQESEDLTTTEDQFFESERRVRFEEAIAEAESELRRTVRPGQADIAVKVFRTRLEEATETGRQRRQNPRATVESLGISYYEERRLWLQGRTLLRRALRQRGELGAPERVRPRTIHHKGERP